MLAVVVLGVGWVLVADAKWARSGAIRWRARASPDLGLLPSTRLLRCARPLWIAVHTRQGVPGARTAAIRRLPNS